MAEYPRVKEFWEIPSVDDTLDPSFLLSLYKAISKGTPVLPSYCKQTHEYIKSFSERLQIFNYHDISFFDIRDPRSEIGDP